MKEEAAICVLLDGENRRKINSQICFQGDVLWGLFVEFDKTFCGLLHLFFFLLLDLSCTIND